MTANELIKECIDFTNDFVNQNAEWVHKSIWGGIQESDDSDATNWKITLNTFHSSCVASVALTLMFLAREGLIDIEPGDVPLPPLPLVH